MNNLKVGDRIKLNALTSDMTSFEHYKNFWNLPREKRKACLIDNTFLFENVQFMCFALDFSHKMQADLVAVSFCINFNFAEIMAEFLMFLPSKLLNKQYQQRIQLFQLLV
jgi:hypothetical protein